MIKKTGIVLGLILFFLCSFCLGGRVYSQTATPTPGPNPSSSTSGVPDCANHNPPISVSDCPAFIESEVNSYSGQADTLQTKIAVMQSQISLTEARIEATEEQITSITLDIDTATKKISSLQGTLDNFITVLINRIVATYEVGTIQPFQILLTSGSASDFFTRLNYLKIAQEHDKQLIYDTQQAKVDYTTQKTILENEKKQVVALQLQLTAYNDQLAQQKQAQQEVLAQVQQDEASAEAEYTQAEAELAGFSKFVISQGGASILTGQTSCDSWGCYYNQRDSQWGNLLINGQQGYSMAEYGCLITSVAMVASHEGHTDILPSTIASSSGDNFAVGTALLKFSLNVNGVSITRNQIGNSSASIPSTVTDPIIVGISYDGGPIADHFVVLTGGSNGNYTMDDPFVPSAHNVNFTDHYSLGSIVEVETVSM